MQYSPYGGTGRRSRLDLSPGVPALDAIPPDATAIIYLTSRDRRSRHHRRHEQHDARSASEPTASSPAATRSMLELVDLGQLRRHLFTHLLPDEPVQQDSATTAAWIADARTRTSPRARRASTPAGPTSRFADGSVRFLKDTIRLLADQPVRPASRSGVDGDIGRPYGLLLRTFLPDRHGAARSGSTRPSRPAPAARSSRPTPTKITRACSVLASVESRGRSRLLPRVTRASTAALASPTGHRRPRQPPQERERNQLGTCQRTVNRLLRIDASRVSRDCRGRDQPSPDSENKELPPMPVNTVTEKSITLFKLAFPALLAAALSGCGSSGDQATSSNKDAALKSIQEAEQNAAARKGRGKAGGENFKSIKGRALGAASPGG